MSCVFAFSSRPRTLARRTPAMGGQPATGRPGCLLRVGIAVQAECAGLDCLDRPGAAGRRVACAGLPKAGRTALRGRRMGLAVSLPALAIGGWWYVRNWALYRDPLAWNVWQANILLAWARPIGALSSASYQPGALLLGPVRLAESALSGLALHSLPRDRDRPRAGAAASVVRALVGLARRARPRPDAGPAPRCCLWLALLAFSWVRFMRIAPTAQGRYFFPAAPFLALLMILGLQGYRCCASRRASSGAPGHGIALARAPLARSTFPWIIGPRTSRRPWGEATVTPLRGRGGKRVRHPGCDCNARPSWFSADGGCDGGPGRRWRPMRTTTLSSSTWRARMDSPSPRPTPMPGGRPAAHQPVDARPDPRRFALCCDDPSPPRTRPYRGRWAVRAPLITARCCPPVRLVLVQTHRFSRGRSGRAAVWGGRRPRLCPARFPTRSGWTSRGQPLRQRGQGK